MTTGVLAHHADIASGIRDWTIAVASLIAAVGAVWAAIPAVRAYRQSTRDRHREHASRFSVWAETVYDADDIEAGVLRPRREFVAHVKNSSDEPMYRVVVVFRDGEDPTQTLATGDPGIDVLPPGETRTVYGSRVHDRPGMAGVWAEAGFTDRAGVRWYRDWRGGLTEQRQFVLGVTPLDEQGVTLG